MKLSIYPSPVPVWSLSAAEALDDATTRTNDGLGYQSGGDVKREGVEMEAEAVIQGMRDALSGAEPGMVPAAMRTTLTKLQRKLVSNPRRPSKEALRC